MENTTKTTTTTPAVLPPSYLDAEQKTVLRDAIDELSAGLGSLANPLARFYVQGIDRRLDHIVKALQDGEPIRQRGDVVLMVAAAAAARRYDLLVLLYVAFKAPASRG